MTQLFSFFDHFAALWFLFFVTFQQIHFFGNQITVEKFLKFFRFILNFPRYSRRVHSTTKNFSFFLGKNSSWHPVKIAQAFPILLRDLSCWNQFFPKGVSPQKEPYKQFYDILLSLKTRQTLFDFLNLVVLPVTSKMR